MRKIRSVKLQILSIHILINFKFFFHCSQTKKRGDRSLPFRVFKNLYFYNSYLITVMRSTATPLAVTIRTM